MMPVRPLDIPEDVLEKLAFLPDDTVEFLKSGNAKGYGRPPDLYERIREFESEAEIAAYVDAILSVTQQIEFQEGRDPAEIPFDTAAPRFNDWHLRRPRELDPQREPGPISLSRYAGGWGSGGIPTFAGSPVALTPEDLKAGEVDVAIMGAPLDMGSGWRDAKHGPRAMRLGGGVGGTDVFTMISPGSLKVVDYGDAAIDQNSTERSVQEVRRMVREIAETGAIPIIIGGDHSLEYPNVAAMADVYGKGKVGVVHFDAHLDTGRGRVHLLDHGQPIYRVMKEAHVRPEDYIQVGLRANYSKDYYEWQRLIGMRYHTMAEVERRGWDAVMDRVVKEASENTEYLYISFDVDVLDPAFEPGTGTPVPGGLTMREAVPIIRRLCAESNVVGFDIVELAPQLDPTYRSAMNGNRLLFACLTGIKMRKEGITDPHYLSPLSSEHGQDDYYGDEG
ncbi:agmatinase family protein [Pacificimonas aurantium]|nr:agmatinase family protein [Pacificimonas aurantium]